MDRQRVHGSKADGESKVELMIGRQIIITSWTFPQMTLVPVKKPPTPISHPLIIPVETFPVGRHHQEVPRMFLMLVGETGVPGGSHREKIQTPPRKQDRDRTRVSKRIDLDLKFRENTLLLLLFLWQHHYTHNAATFHSHSEGLKTQTLPFLCST